jgi:hypothetical protein
MSPARRALAPAAIGCLAAAGVAQAAHPITGATYRARIDHDRVAFKVSRTGKTMRFRGTATVGLFCPPFGAPPGPPAAVLVISSSAKQLSEGASAPPLVRIHANGTFSGARKGLYFTGRFTRAGKSLVLRIRIQDPGCRPRRPRYTFRVR